jgi:hypothetical protein
VTDEQDAMVPPALGIRELRAALEAVESANRVLAPIPEWVQILAPEIIGLAIKGAERRASEAARLTRTALGYGEYRIDEGQRQILLLALAELSVARPGWKWAIRDLAERLHGGEMFDNLASLALLGPIGLLGQARAASELTAALEWLQAVADHEAALLASPSAEMLGGRNLETIRAAKGHALYLLTALGVQAGDVEASRAIRRRATCSSGSASRARRPTRPARSWSSPT